MVYEKTLIAQATVKANAPAYSEITVKILSDPRTGFDNEVRIPVNETWIIKDIYVKSNPIVDLSVRVVKNYRKPLQEIILSTQNISNPARKPPTAMLFDPGDVLTIDARNLTAGGSSDTVIEFYMTVEIYEEGVDY